MYNIKTLNKISNVGLSKFDKSKYVYGDDIENPDAIMVRSASMHDMEMPKSLLAIARAGAGTNNIPVADCADKGIVVFNTPGANANAVKELVILGLLLSSRKVTKRLIGAKQSKTRATMWAKPLKKANPRLQVPKSRAKHSALSVSALSADLLPMLLLISV